MSTIVTVTMNPSLDIASETDLLSPDVKLRCAAPRYDAGGGGINVARAIRLLGGDALALFPSGGPSGKTISDILEKEGVRFGTIPIAGSTRENFHVAERATGKQYRFVIEGPALDAEEQEACLQQIETLRPTPEFLVASGSLPPGVTDNFYAELAHIARSKEMKLVLDAPGSILRKAAPGAYLLKPSLQELEEMVGSPLPTEGVRRDALQTLIGGKFAKVILLSLGGEGAILAVEGQSWFLPPIKVPVRSTVGAGDSMVAAMVYSLSRGWSPLDAAKYAVAAATAAVLHSGTQLCRREDVERFYAAYSIDARENAA